MRLATARLGDRAVGCVAGDGGLFPLPDGQTVDDLVRLGLTRALDVAAAALP